jgi:branched-chain amino acid transport system substrate-binding protein
MARLTRDAARARGLEILGLRRLRPRTAAGTARGIAREARRRGADAVYFGGTAVTGARPLWRALGRVRGLKLFGPDGLALESFLRRLSPPLQRRTQVTLLPMDPSAYPEAGQEVLRTLGDGTDLYALYAYEAMSVVLDAIARGASGGRSGVIEAFFRTTDRDSVLGRYSIDPNGDTTLTRYGIYGVRGGRLVWDRAVDTAAP